ncbi:MAG: viroplasmin family protein [Bacteroidetes bacterium]|nr:viroplasmin family protein [Bacteroidota bacterium]
MTIKKYYVVWVGRYAGIFESWEDCNEQIFSYPKAVYKSFKSKELAEKAFNSSSKEFIGQDVFETEFLEEQLKKIGDPIKDSISVDGAWNTSTEINTFLSDWDTYNSTDLVNMGIDYDIWLQTNYSLPPWPSIANLTDVQALVGSQSTSTFATFLAQATTYHTSTTYLFSFMSSSDFIQQLGSIGSLTTTVIQVQFTATDIFTALAQAGLATLWGNIQDEEIAVTGDDHLILQHYETNHATDYVHQCIIVLPSFIDSYISQSVSDYLQLIKVNYTTEQYANLMAALTELYYIPTQTLQLAEWHIYGSSRIGIYKADKPLAVVEDEVITSVSYQTRVKFRYNGKKQYELSNHLGNVLVTISDRRTAICNEVDSTLRYEAVVVTANDYYSFGSPLIGRSYQAESIDGYRFGFNGQENDNEVKGDGNSIAYESRIYDSRLGRWLSVDPLQNKFPFESNYCFVSNNPIFYIDIKGQLKMDPKQAKDYPTLAKFINQELANYVLNNTEIKNEIVRLTGANDEQMNRIFQPAGNSPLVRVTSEFPIGILGLTDKYYMSGADGIKQTEISLDQSFLTEMEARIKSGDKEQSEAAKMAIMMLVVHEGVHATLAETGALDINKFDGDGNDVGKQFEKNIYKTTLLKYAEINIVGLNTKQDVNREAFHAASEVVSDNNVSPGARLPAKNFKGNLKTENKTYDRVITPEQREQTNSTG